MVVEKLSVGAMPLIVYCPKYSKITAPNVCLIICTSLVRHYREIISHYFFILVKNYKTFLNAKPLQNFACVAVLLLRTNRHYNYIILYELYRHVRIIIEKNKTNLKCRYNCQCVHIIII